ncbi:hydroxypyruvate isomerase [Paenibacillus cellulosilyticus]|uniref:Hydroxypyruvate isomerase n=1 Tax=Paenibacillus cellulosilyticus TaxID=375489 RepID=A0A2V2YUQ0_9BACL|nr:TIM barrel protein [Paenibacillus cellulosilyticus]PWW00981.1 hydroxypyruvate isomerase [Paenibacillus cellulosilyticus]QKS47623.1 TIM barrel protein [Paenibacillus cellulosilyticus]
MKPSICIDSVCRDMELTEALSLVKSSGYDAFEFWNWSNKDIQLMENAMKRLGLSVATFCTQGGSLVDSETHQAFLDGLSETVKVAQRLGCGTLIVTAGNELPEVSREAQIENIVIGLRSAVPILEATGITLTLEPLNTAVDHPGYILARSDEAFDIIDQVGSEHVKVLYDIYHQQITEGNLMATMLGRLSSIGHTHAAGCPGRHELHTGEIHYANVFHALQSAGYAHYVGLEYFPSQDVVSGLEKTRELFNR